LQSLTTMNVEEEGPVKKEIQNSKAAMLSTMTIIAKIKDAFDQVFKVLVPFLREKIDECEITDHECVFYYTFGTRKLESLKKKRK
jgi:hypothetical protein